jgi:hypothetical protein
VAVAGDGAAAATWIENRSRPAQRVRAVVRDTGGAFGAAETISPVPGAGVRGARVAVDEHGDALAIWEAGVYRKYDRGHVEAAYRAAGGSFGPARRISPDGISVPRLAMSAEGHAIVAWNRGSRVEAVAVEHGRAGSLQTVGVSGTPTRSTYAFEPDAPAIAVGPDGSAAMAWIGVLPRPQGVDGDADTRPRVVRLARRATSAARFAPAAVVRRVTYRQGLFNVTIAAGPGRRAFAAWKEVGPYPLEQLVGVYAGPPGTRPAPPRALATDEGGGLDSTPALAFAPDGTLVAAWGWFLDAERSGLRVASGRGALGTPQTISEPVPLEWGVRDEMRPQLSLDRTGAATVFWNQQRAVLGPGNVMMYPSTPQVTVGTPG